MTTTMNAYDDAQKFGKEQMDRALASMNAFSRGIQAIAAEVTDYQKKSFEESSAAVEKLFAVRSVERALEVQTEIARQSYESFVGRATRISELYVDLARDAYKPFEGVVGTPRA